MPKTKKFCKKRVKVGLALGSGAWRGLAHIGVIKSLLKNNIPIDFIAGCSTGSMIGGYYAATQDIDEVEKTFTHLTQKKLLLIFLDPSLHDGICKGKKVTNYFEQFVKGVMIEEMKTPFCALTADIDTGLPVQIKTGKLSLAVRASGSVPFLFSPATINGKRLIDGAAISPVPVWICKEMGADVVIAVNLSTNYFSAKKKTAGAIQITLRTTQLMAKTLAEHDCQAADVCICPKIEEPNKYTLIRKFTDSTNSIDIGEEAAEKKIAKIKSLIKVDL